jgi:hypothetical protein
VTYGNSPQIGGGAQLAARKPVRRSAALSMWVFMAAAAWSRLPDVSASYTALVLRERAVCLLSVVEGSLHPNPNQRSDRLQQVGKQRVLGGGCDSLVESHVGRDERLVVLDSVGHRLEVAPDLGDGLRRAQHRGESSCLHLQSVSDSNEVARLRGTDQHSPGQGLGEQFGCFAPQVGAGTGAYGDDAENL